MYKCNFIILPSYERFLSSGHPWCRRSRRRKHLKPRKIARWSLHKPTSLTKHAFMAVVFIFVFFLSCQIGREDVPLWMIYKAVCISFSWHSTAHVISAHFLLQSCFIQCKGARFLLHTTLMSQQKIPSRSQWDEMKIAAPSFINFTQM